MTGPDSPEGRAALVTAVPDLRRAPVSAVRATDFRELSRDVWADEAALWDRLIATWAGIDDAGWRLPGLAPSDAGGPPWSLHDHVAHLADWSELAGGYVRRVLDGGAWPTDRDFDEGDFDAFNERRRAIWAERAPAETRARLMTARSELVNLARRLPPASLRDDAAWGWVFGVLHGHVVDHLGLLEGWADALRARQADGDPFVADPRPPSLEAFWAADREIGDALRGMLAAVPQSDWAAGEVTPGWTFQAHLGHLADWAQEGVRAVAAFRATGAWSADPEEGIDVWNARMVEAHADEAPAATADRYRRWNEAMRDAVASLTLDELREPEGWSWAHDCLYGHVRKHLAMFGPWVARRSWPRSDGNADH